MFTLIMIFVLLFLVIVLYNLAIKEHKNKIISNESFSNNIGNKGTKLGSTDKKPYEGTFNSTFNGRMAIDDQYFYDKLFDDVVYYPNEYATDYNLGDLLATGWQKCKMECKGHCVEYNISGNSYCFN